MGVPLNYSKSLILDWDFPLYKPTSQPAIGVALSMAPPQMSYGCGNTFFFCCSVSAWPWLVLNISKLVGGLEHDLFFHILGISSSHLTSSYLQPVKVS